MTPQPPSQSINGLDQAGASKSVRNLKILQGFGEFNGVLIPCRYTIGKYFVETGC